MWDVGAIREACPARAPRPAAPLARPTAQPRPPPSWETVRNGLVAVHLGAGGGAFSAPTYYNVGKKPLSLAVGDLSGVLSVEFKTNLLRGPPPRAGFDKS